MVTPSPCETYALEIELLRERVEHLFQLADWAHQQWYASQGCDVDHVRERFVRRLNSATLPIAWVALARGEPVGMVSLVRQRSPEDRVIPCLAELYVTPEYRRRGLGQQLCDRAIACARAWRYPKLYLYCTPAETYYYKYGWRQAWDAVIRRNNREAILLGKDLNRDSPANDAG